MKSIYTYYKERLIEISGRNRSLYLKNFNRKNGFDIGKILYENQELAGEFLSNLWNGNAEPFRIIGKNTKDSILKSSNIDDRYPEKEFEDEKEKAKYDRKKKETSKKIVEYECQSLRILKREIEEIEKETGRYELYLCYPFVYGASKNYLFKAPLLMFPVVVDVIDDGNVDILLKQGDSIQLNKALLLAIADAHRLNLEGIETEFDSLSKFNGIQGILDYLRKFGIKISYQSRKNVFPFGRYDEPNSHSHLEVKNLCVLSRCSLANSIYADYSALEKKHLTNDSINELLNTKIIKHKPEKSGKLFLVNNVDYAQQQVVKQVNTSGNMVIYGPPGTGKSQTIVNVISDAISKGKKVLVVSQKKAALEVIYNRMGTLNDKAMFLTDAEKEKRSFYSRCFASHEKMVSHEINERLIDEYEEAEKQLAVESNNLKMISNCLTEVTPFGISAQDMYCNSYKIGKNSVEYAVYKDMLQDSKLMGLKYQELAGAIELLQEKNKAEIYYNFVEDKKKNPFIDHLQETLSVHTVAEAQNKLEKLCLSRKPLFDTAKYKFSRQVLTYYHEIKTKKDISPLIKLIARFEFPKDSKFLKVSKVMFPMYPFAKVKIGKKEKYVKAEIKKTVAAIEEYVKDYDFLKNVLSAEGYLMAIDGLLNGNNSVLRLLLSAVQNYIKLRDVNIILKNLEDNQKIVLNFAYRNSNTYTKYKLILEKILPIRIYHEIVSFEAEKKDMLSTIVNFENIKARIVALKSQLNTISRKVAEQSFVEDYRKMLKGTAEAKDYAYQISKKQSFWTIRKMMSVYGKYLFKLFPCWLLSPENVSNILPLERNMFDIVLFDEASQVFIENTIPTIYRGSRIVVAGDAKQLRPTATFMKRYMGANIDDNLDYSTQAALEVESLLDLAVSRFNSANINYHYRSKHEELIDFSNKAFYENRLQIAPNVSKNIKQKPIERILVNGIWCDRKNLVEAKKVVELTKQILKTRKNRETIGIITFNSEQEMLIEDLIDKECGSNDEFRKLFIEESNRVENGEDVSIFIKNLENVQGDERDIIIFSIGYAANDYGKVNATFGSLSNEGGENRLNVAITRAKKKIYVVTSIEPEKLKVEGSKFAGPKLLRSYLTYVRAVSEGNTDEVKTILNSFGETTTVVKKSLMTSIEEQISNRLEKLGYKTELNLGNSNSKISIAVYDKKKDRYLLGIETDQSVLASSASPMERDVYRSEFLKSRGWKICRVWSRDYWHNPSQVISQLVREIEKQKKALYAENAKTTRKTKKDA